MVQKYTVDFKQTIVELHQNGTSVQDLVNEYGLASQTVYKWIKLYGKDQKASAELPTLHEVQMMRKEMAKMREENEILKKALTIFAKK